jgi:hypothetical protein
MSHLCYLCLFVYSGVLHILCCVFVCLYLVYHMLTVSLYCPLLIAPSVCYNVYSFRLSSYISETCTKFGHVIGH